MELSFLAMRDFNLAALFGWITPLRAALSRTLVAKPAAVRDSSKEPVSNARCAFVRYVLILRRIERFLSILRLLTLADLILGTCNILLDAEV